MRERNILIVNSDEREAETLAADLGRANSAWRVRFAAGSSAVEKSMQSTRLDAFVIDGMFPGITQEDLLKRASSHSPTSFRLALSGNYDHGAMLRTMGIAHQNLWKPCPTADIRAALARAFALRDALQNDRLQLLIAQINSLPSLPRLYLDFLDEVRKQSPSSARLGEIIRRDLSLCSKLLQLVNSAFFGLPRKIDNPEEALHFLGLENVRALVLSLQVFSLFGQVKVRRFSLESLWDHSWKVSALARTISVYEKRPAEEIEAAFTAGLLHDLGKLVLVSGVPRSWENVLEAVESDEAPLWQLEREMLGATHAEVGAALLAIWGLSDQVVEAVAFHHEPALSGLNSFCALTAVHAANLLVDKPVEAVPSPYLESVSPVDSFTAWRRLASDSTP